MGTRAGSGGTARVRVVRAQLYLGVRLPQAQQERRGVLAQPEWRWLLAQGGVARAVVLAPDMVTDTR